MPRKHQQLADLSNPDDSPVAEACADARRWLVRHYGDPHILALRFFGSVHNSGRIAHDDFTEEEDLDRVAHAKGCASCETWVWAVVGLKVMHRQRRLAEYCCSLMFAAVEEPRRGYVRVQFGKRFHPESGPSWSIEESTIAIAYCPWCGQQLPPEPFVEFVNPVS